MPVDMRCIEGILKALAPDKTPTSPQAVCGAPSVTVTSLPCGALRRSDCHFFEDTRYRESVLLTSCRDDIKVESGIQAWIEA